MSRLNRARLKLWTDALRSGNYEQAKQALARIDHDTGQWSYCCLGVACEVAMANGLDIPTEMSRTGTRRYDGSQALMPSSVCHWFGLPGDLWVPASIEGDGDTRKMVTELNDDYDWDFNQIADAIEAKFRLREDEIDGE